MKNKIILPQLLKEQMLEHALSDPDIEVCGLIGGIDNRATTIYPVNNIAEDPAHNFLMDPEPQIAVMKLLREKHESLWGIYHSHPDKRAIPSERDLQLAAYPGVNYFIVSVIDDLPELNAYKYDGSKFEKLILDMI